MTDTWRISVGSRVRVVVSDPWELYESAGGADGVLAIVKAIRGSAVLLQLDAPLSIGCRKYREVMCSPRGDTRGATTDGRVYSCIAIPPEHAGNPFDMSWWRGGGAFIGTIYLC